MCMFFQLSRSLVLICKLLIHSRTTKPVVFVSARVHPGEAPSSYILHGLIQYLRQPRNRQAAMLLKKFTFMIVPMINPDGVYRGYFRLDINSNNLNRVYGSPQAHREPAVYAIRALLRQLDSDKRLFFYLDLHAHATRQGCFLFGNSLELSKQVENVLFARLMQANSPHFDFSNSIFTEKNMT